MIGNISYYRTPQRIKLLFAYLVKGIEEERSKVIGGNMGSRRISNPLALIGNQKIVGHVSLSFDDRDNLNNNLLRAISEDFLTRYLIYCRKSQIKEYIIKAINSNLTLVKLTKSEIADMYERLNEHSYLIVRHYDTEHRHIHLAFDCQNLVDDFMNYLHPMNFNKKLAEFIIRQLELEYDLRILEPSWVLRQREGIKGTPLSAYYVKQLGFQGRRKLKAILTDGIEECSDWASLKAYCRVRGVTVDKDQDKLLYQYHGVYIKPLQLGYSYSVHAIERKFDEKRHRQKTMGNLCHERDQTVYE
jgi:hypothetical protein